MFKVQKHNNSIKRASSEFLMYVDILFVQNLQYIMYLLQFYVYKRTGIRLTSKHDVLHYMNEGELPGFVNAACDISTDDNVSEGHPVPIYHIELRPRYYDRN